MDLEEFWYDFKIRWMPSDGSERSPMNHVEQQPMSANAVDVLPERATDWGVPTGQRRGEDRSRGLDSQDVVGRECLKKRWIGVAVANNASMSHLSYPVEHDKRHYVTNSCTVSQVWSVDAEF